MTAGGDDFDAVDGPAARPVLVRTGLDRARADAALLVLVALGIPAESLREIGGTIAIAVREADLVRADELLADVEAETPLAAPAGEGTRDGRAAPGLSSGKSNGSGGGDAAIHRRPWLDRSSLVVLAVVAACIAAYLATTGGATHATWEQMLHAGAVASDRIDRGEAWRFATAVFLHFDYEHLLANLGTLLFVGPLLAREIGVPRFLAVFLGAGVAGNLASWVLAPSAGLKAGASGAIAGVIGALAGESLGGASLLPRRFRRWQVVAALAAFPTVRYVHPAGAFYLYINVAGFRGAADAGAAFAAAMLEEHQVAVVPGSAFLTPNWIRASYATTESVAVEGVTRIARCLTGA